MDMEKGYEGILRILELNNEPRTNYIPHQDKSRNASDD